MDSYRDLPRKKKWFKKPIKEFRHNQRRDTPLTEDVRTKSRKGNLQGSHLDRRKRSFFSGGEKRRIKGKENSQEDEREVKTSRNEKACSSNSNARAEGKKTAASRGEEGRVGRKLV